MTPERPSVLERLKGYRAQLDQKSAPARQKTKNRHKTRSYRQRPDRRSYSLSVLQNVLHGRLGYMSGVKGVFGLYSEEDKQEALDLLKELGLEDYAYNRASDLSGGQKQRVGIARAIMQNPKLLLCDEPIASLDPSSAKTIMDLLRDMTRKRNIACIVNLHQLDVALKYSTRIIGLSKGEIVFDGSPERLDDDTIERIYGTSRENLMMGGSGDDQADTADCA